MDRVRSLTREYRASQWAEIVRTRQSSGKSIRVWCEENGVTEKSFYYWQRKFREEVCNIIEQNTAPILSLPSYAEINMPSPVKSESITAVIIRIGEATAEIHSDATPETIENVIRALKLIC